MPSSNESQLSFTCDSCNKRLKASRKLAGRKVDCPRCGAKLTIPDFADQDGAASAKTSSKSPKASSTGGSLLDSPPEVLEGLLSLDGPAISDIVDRERTSREIKDKREQERVSKRKKRTSGAKAPLGAVQPVKAAKTETSKAEDPLELADEEKVDVQAIESITPSSPDAESPKRQTPSEIIESSTAESAESVDEEDEYRLAPVADNATKSGAKSTPADVLAGSSPPSAFDDDLPELADLDEPEPQRKGKQFPGVDLSGLDDLDDLVPDLGEAQDLDDKRHGDPQVASGIAGEFDDDLDGGLEDEGEYRVVCNVCGTAQYIPPSAQGLKIKCPDCFDQFKAPPPPKGWSAKKPAKKKDPFASTSAPLMDADAGVLQREEESTRARTSAMLDKAARDIDEEELDELYENEFDTATFVQNTFGFLKDPICLTMLAAYGIIFACVFWMVRFGTMSKEGWDQGYWFLGVLIAPMIGILFLLPMISAGLALLESVANRQTRVSEWPGFDLFDNMGDLLAVAVAIGLSVLPGFFLGYWVSQGFEVASGRVHLACMLGSSLFLFPVFLLSMLDNGSLFQPISGAVVVSLGKAAESWGAYYIKTLCAFGFTVVAWFMLLGSLPILAAVGGILFVVLFFFTFQQVGGLAERIGEHLSFEFAPPDADEDDDELE